MRILLVLAFLALKGCDEPQAVWQSGTVSDVRMTFESQPQRVEPGNPVGGAIAGHIVAGKTGAIIGAIAASGDTIIPASGKLIACQFKVKLDSGEEALLTFVSEYDHRLPKCSLQREGDKIKLVKYPYRQNWDWE